MCWITTLHSGITLPLYYPERHLVESLWARAGSRLFAFRCPDERDASQGSHVECKRDESPLGQALGKIQIIAKIRDSLERR